MARYGGDWYEEFVANGTVPGWYQRGMDEGKFRYFQDWYDRTVAALRAREPRKMELHFIADLERKKEVEANLWSQEQNLNKRPKQQTEDDTMVCSPGKIPVIRENSPQPETPKRLKPRTRREYIDIMRERAPRMRGFPTPPPRIVNIGPIRPFPSPTPSPSPSPLKSNITAGVENDTEGMEVNSAGVENDTEAMEVNSAGSTPLSITFTPQEGVLERLEPQPHGMASIGRMVSCGEGGQRDSIEPTAQATPLHLTFTPQEGVLERLEPQFQQSGGNLVGCIDSGNTGGAMELDGGPSPSSLSNQEDKNSTEGGGNGAPNPSGNDGVQPRPVLKTIHALFEEFGGRRRADGEPDTGSDLLKPRTALSELGFTSRHSLSTAGSNIDHLDITESIVQHSTGAGPPQDFGRRSSISTSDPMEATVSDRQQTSGEQPRDSHNDGFSFSTPGQASEGRESTPSLQTGQGGWREMSTTPNHANSEKEGIPQHPSTTSSLGSWGVSPQPTAITPSDQGKNSQTPPSQVDGSQQGVSLCTPNTGEKENGGLQNPRFRPPTPWAAPQPSPVSTNSTLHSIDMPSERHSLESQQTPSQSLAVQNDERHSLESQQTPSQSLAVQNDASPTMDGLVDNGERGTEQDGAECGGKAEVGRLEVERGVVDCGVGGSDDDFGGEGDDFGDGGESMDDGDLRENDGNDPQIGEGNREEDISEMAGLNDSPAVRNDFGGAQNVGEAMVTVGTQVSPLFAQNNKKKALKRKKPSRGVVKKKPVPRTSLCGSDVGLAWAEEDQGQGRVRRSQRTRIRPLRYWEGETKEYGRDHKTLPTVVGFSMWTPEPEPHNEG
ncbi:hypothetical protein BSKO_07441 [Bryopsis sp. KO-2023]|nr:hypothetical protein BSKO_07441 [Bryopsis sp. KO-2023]